MPQSSWGLLRGLHFQNDSNLGKADQDTHEHQYVQCVDKSQLQSPRAEIMRHLDCNAIWNNIGDVTLDAMHLPRSICPNAIRLATWILKWFVWSHGDMIPWSEIFAATLWNGGVTIPLTVAKAFWTFPSGQPVVMSTFSKLVLNLLFETGHLSTSNFHFSSSVEQPGARW